MLSTCCDGYLTKEECGELEELLKSGDDNDLMESDAFMSFRSWYKAGQEVAARDALELAILEKERYSQFLFGLFRVDSHRKVLFI